NTCSKASQALATEAASNCCPLASWLMRLSCIPKRREKPAARTIAIAVTGEICSQLVTRFVSLHSYDIRHYGQGDFGRSLAAQVQTNGHVQPRYIVFAQTSGAQQALPADLRRLQGAHHADIESRSAYGFDHGQVIDARVMAEC